jgi:hypothetical protein
VLRIVQYHAARAWRPFSAAAALFAGVLAVSSLFAAGPPDSISIDAEPSEISCNDDQASLVTASVIDGNGDPVDNGTTVNFSVIGNGYASPTSAQTLGGDASTQVFGTVPSDTSLTVVATAGSAQEQLFIECNPIYGPGSIRGTVTEFDGGAPIAGATVNALRVVTGADPCCELLGTGISDVDGTFEITGLPPGNYDVSADAFGYQEASQQPIFVNRSSVTHDVNLTLLDAGSIAGRVTGGGVGLAGVFVRAMEDPGDFGFFAQTDAQGFYVIEDLESGLYDVVHVFGTGSRAPEVYNDTYDFNLATEVLVSSGGQAQDINFDLALGATLSGTIRDPNGVALEGADVTASNGDWFFGATSGPDGAYAITGMAPGTYTIEAVFSGLADTWHGGAFDEAGATPVNVALGSPVTGKDIMFGDLGSISGTVTNVPGLFGATIDTRRSDCDFCGGTNVSSDGPYAITGLQPGCYKVFASSFQHGTQYYDGKFYDNIATPVCVTEGANTPNINFVLGAQDPDDFEDLLPIPLPGNDARSTVGASLEVSEPQTCGNIGATIWYRFAVDPVLQPGAQVEVTTAGSAFDTVVAVYSGDHILSPPGGIAPVACNDDAGGPQARLQFAATPGATYYVQLGGKNGATGSASLLVRCVGDADCDSFADGPDNCDSVYNPNQHDFPDHDGAGNACDPDIDDDGLTNTFERTFGTEETFSDTDFDRCDDGEEYLGENPQSGGDRDPLNFYDFYDVTNDGAIDLSDALAILNLFGAVPGDPSYDRAFDRYVPDTSRPHATAQASGTFIGIDLGDALANLQSFGHSCAGP